MFNNAVMHLTDAAGMANRVDFDQIVPEKQSDLGLPCLLSPMCLNDSNFFLYSSGEDILTSTQNIILVILQAPITTAADDNHKYSFIVFQRNETSCFK